MWCFIGQVFSLCDSNSIKVRLVQLPMLLQMLEDLIIVQRLTRATSQDNPNKNKRHCLFIEANTFPFEAHFGNVV